MIEDSFTSFDDLDKVKFQNLIASGFGKYLVDDYFKYLNPAYINVVEDMEGNYIGATVTEEFKEGLYYLDKLVVAKDYQNNGIGKKLWDCVIEQSSKLVWRAKPLNHINKIYVRECEGMQKFEPWFVYWKGLDPVELVEGIGYALDKKETLVG
jgi:acetylglutamate synthase|tara:strand:+ start:2803 stop:3261 length:459 start_codon:yes stop_codon:yes gene_type:complete